MSEDEKSEPNQGGEKRVRARLRHLRRHQGRVLAVAFRKDASG